MTNKPVLVTQPNSVPSEIKMATTKQVMCSMVLIVLLVIASSTLSLSPRIFLSIYVYVFLYMVLTLNILGWKATAVNPDCYTPPNKKMPCSISMGTRRACKNQCIQENYSNGDCYYVSLLFKLRCLCQKPGCK